MTRLTALALLAACALPASAQNALGAGGKLDKNSQRGSGGVNNAVQDDIQQSLMLRNAIVTGNAPGGLSFRGSVGYVGEREFRGELGSDDLFSFRRDSLYSGISGLGIRGTDALQYQFALTTGSAPPSAIAGSLAISRDSFAPTVGGLGADTGAVPSNQGPIRRLDPDFQQNAAGTGLWRLRSTSGYLTDKSLASSYVGTIQSTDGTSYDLTASPLEGIRATTVPVVSPGAAALRSPAVSSTQNLIDRLRLDPAAPLTGAGLTGHEQILSKLRDIYTPAAPEQREPSALVEQILLQNERLRSYIEGITQTTPLDLPEGQTPPEPAPELDDEDLSPRERMLRDFERLEIDPAVIQALRESATLVEDLTAQASPQDRDFYAVHMSQGQRSLAEGNYFDAEARFALALSIRPGDPTAAIARVHAQIGAGLSLSASANLRETFTQNPTMTTARYAPGLIPPDARLRDSAERLRALSDGSGLRARQSALVLAYVGYHLRDDALVKQGLDRLELESEDRLAALLRLVWLDRTPLEQALERVPQSVPQPGGENPGE